MAWERLRGMLRGRRDSGHGPQPEAEIPWVPATENPWRVPVLDVRPLTLGSRSVTADPQCAANAVSFSGDDGTGFIGEEPEIERATPADICFRRDRLLADGALFIPDEMEHKWALYFHRGRILCIRSWLRKVRAVAEVEQKGQTVRVTTIRGVVTDEDEEQRITVRALDYLLRTHALGAEFPAPLPRGMEEDPSTAAAWCMSHFGNLAHFATPSEIEADIPEKPLRTHPLLHIAVARGDAQAADEQLRAGVPVDLLAADGLAPMHWALATQGTAMLEWLLRRGSPVDVRSEEGATPLMNLAQDGDVERTMFLLDRGADPNVADLCGFTALHRAAELGHAEVAKLLLARGASPSVRAQGQTPLSLAEQRGHDGISKLLRERDRGIVAE